MIKKNKIVHIITSFDREILDQVLLLCCKLDLTRYEQCIVAFDKRVKNLVKDVNCEYLDLATLQKENLTFYFAKFFRKHKFNVVHLHNTKLLSTIAWAAFWSGVKLVTSVYDQKEESVSGLTWRLNKFVIAVSEDVKEHLQNNCRVPKNKIQLIKSLIDSSIYRENDFSVEEKNAIKVSLGIKENTFVVGNVNDFLKENDQETLLKAFKKFALKNADAELVLVGEGAYRHYLEKLVNDLNLFGRVKFLTPNDEERIMNCFDVYVCSTYREICSLSIMKAMFKAIPVIVTKVGGAINLIVDQKNGYLVPCGFPERIESVLMRLKVNPLLMRQIAEEGQKTVIDQFNLERALSVYQGIYQK